MNEKAPATRVQLIYASIAHGRISADDVRSILDASERNNLQSGITGMLCYGEGHFLQCLEGPRQPVNDTYLRIATDPRHAGAVILAYKDVERRDFPGWSMGYLGITRDAQRIVERFAPEGFAPLEMSGLDAFGLLLELKTGLASQTVSR